VRVSSLSWRLWRALRNPPEEQAIYRRTLGVAHSVTLFSLCRFRESNRILAGILSLFFLPIVAFAGPALFFFLVFNSTVYGVFWAASISVRITTERLGATYDLLCLTPAGTLGTNWAISTASIYRNETFKRLNVIVRGLVIAALFVATIVTLIFVLILIADAEDRPANELRVLSLAPVYVYAFIAAFYIDHVQSVVLSALIGMLTPYYVQNTSDAQLWAAGSFLVLQISTYLVTIFTGVIVLPALYAGRTGWLIDSSIPVLSLLVFYTLREGYLRIVWSRLIRRMDIRVHPDENWQSS